MSEQRLIDANSISAPFNHESDEFVRGIIYACDHITNDEPTIDHESLRPHGRWEASKRTFISGYDGIEQYTCSNCGYIRFMTHNFCPNCGARMDKEDT